jgi:hypothetical protein
MPQELLQPNDRNAGLGAVHAERVAVIPHAE